MAVLLCRVSFIKRVIYVKCLKQTHYAECHYAECRHTNSLYAESHSTLNPALYNERESAVNRMLDGSTCPG